MHPDRSDIVLEELARLREEVISTRNVSIKTDNVIKNLSTEIRAITERQSQVERRSFINSIAAYVIFVVLIATGLFLVFEAKLQKQDADKALFDRKEATFKREIAELKAELGRWKQIERELLEFERLVKEGNKEQAVEKFASLRSVRFSGLLEDLTVRFRADVAKEKYDRALDLYKQGSFDKASEAFVKSIEYNSEPPYLAELLYYQGMSALRLKDYPKAAELLQKAIDSNLPKQELPEARFYVAQAYDRMGEKRTAMDLYARFHERYEEHSLASQALKRYLQLKGPTEPVKSP